MREAAGDREAADAAAAADALGEHAVGGVALGDDHPGGGDRDIAGVTRRAAAAAAHGGGGILFKGGAEADGEAARAAAAAHRLGEDAIGLDAACADVAGMGDADVARRAAAAAGPADGGGVSAALGRQRRADREAADAAAAAHGLGEDGVGVEALGHKGALAGDRDIAGRAAKAARAAADVRLGVTLERCAQADREAAGTAAAADRLGQDGVGLVTQGADVTRLVHRNIARITARARAAADAGTGRAAL